MRGAIPQTFDYFTRSPFCTLGALPIPDDLSVTVTPLYEVTNRLSDAVGYALQPHAKPYTIGDILGSHSPGMAHLRRLVVSAAALRSIQVALLPVGPIATPSNTKHLTALPSLLGGVHLTLDSSNGSHTNEPIASTSGPLPNLDNAIDAAILAASGSTTWRYSDWKGRTKIEGGREPTLNIQNNLQCFKSGFHYSRDTIGAALHKLTLAASAIAHIARATSSEGMDDAWNNLTIAVMVSPLYLLAGVPKDRNVNEALLYRVRRLAATLGSTSLTDHRI